MNQNKAFARDTFKKKEEMLVGVCEKKKKFA